LHFRDTVIAAGGNECVPIRPFVLAPQMKKLPPSSQKSRVRKPSRSARNVLRNGLPSSAAVRRPPSPEHRQVHVGGCSRKIKTRAALDAHTER